MMNNFKILARKSVKLENESGAANVVADKPLGANLQDSPLTGFKLFRSKVSNFLRSEKVRNELERRVIHDYISVKDMGALSSVAEAKNISVIDPDKLTEAMITKPRMSKQQINDLLSPDAHNIIKEAMEGYVRFNKKANN